MSSNVNLTRPEALRDARRGDEIIINYDFEDGTARRLVGRLDAFLVRDGVITGIEMRLNLARSASCPLTDRLSRESPRNPVARLKASRISPAPAAPSPIRAARREEPTGSQVSYALALADRWEDQGTLFPGMTRDRFQAMSRRELSDWIGIARTEMGLED